MSITFIHGDCLEALRSMGDNSIQLVAADPPYGTTQNAWDVPICSDVLFDELWRVCSGAVVLNASQPFSSDLVVRQKSKFKHEWVWEKNKATGHLNAKRMPMKAHEQVLVFAQGKYVYNPQMTDGHKPMNTYTQTSNGDCYGSTKRPSGGGATKRYPRSIQYFPVINNDDPNKTHSTQKPVDLMRYIIRTYSNPGDVVLDFCCGSGTTGVAAAIEGRSAVLIEKDEAFSIAARDRVEKSLAQSTTKL